MANVVSMKALLESGVHFGHRTNKWHPKMKPYIFTERNGIYIIDLQQTVRAFNEAYVLIRDIIMEGGKVLFVGTKRQAQETIRDEASRCGMPYVTERWLGGTLTNWSTISQRIGELERLENLRDSGEINRLTKKEGLMIERQIRKLETRLSGLRDMADLPDVLFVVDVNREATAVHEANLKGIPVVALVDTNCNPSQIDYIIPSNEDAIRVSEVIGDVPDALTEIGEGFVCCLIGVFIRVPLRDGIARADIAVKAFIFAMRLQQECFNLEEYRFACIFWEDIITDNQVQHLRHGCGWISFRIGGWFIGRWRTSIARNAIAVSGGCSTVIRRW